MVEERRNDCLPIGSLASQGEQRAQGASTGVRPPQVTAPDAPLYSSVLATMAFETLADLVRFCDVAGLRSRPTVFEGAVPDGRGGDESAEKPLR